MSWFKKTQPTQESPIIIFNIGGATVSGLVLDSRSRDLLFETREDLPFNSTQDFSVATRQTTKTLSDISQRLKRFVSEDPQQVHCLLSSAWHIADSRKIRVKTQTKNKSVLEDITSEGLRRHLTLHQTPSYQLTPIDSLILGLELDGQRHTNLDFSLPGEKTVHHFSSSSDANLLNSLREPIRSGFGQSETQFHSGLLSTFAVLKETMANHHDFVILDIGGEVTDLVIVRGQTIIDIASIPVGTHSIARQISKLTGQNNHSAYSSLHLLGENIIQNHRHNDFSNYLANIKNEWLYSLASILEQYEKPGENLPVVVVGDDKSAVVLSGWLKDLPDHQPIVADSEFLADHYPTKRPPSRVPSHLLAQLFAQKYLWYTSVVLLVAPSTL